MKIRRYKTVEELKKDRHWGHLTRNGARQYSDFVAGRSCSVDDFILGWTCSRFWTIIEEEEMTVEKSVEEKLVEGLEEFVENESYCGSVKELASALLEKIKPVPEKRMYLKVDNEGDLGVFYGDDEILYLDREDGEVSDYFDCDNVRECFEKWMADGTKFDGTVVEWEGMEDTGKYFLTKSRGCVFLIRGDIGGGSIFNITHRCPMQSCDDPNITKDSQGIPWII